MAGTGGMYDNNGVNDGERTWDLYKARDVKTTINDTLMWGFQSGDMVSVQKTNNDIEPASDAQGSAAAAANYDALGTGTVNLRQMTPLNKELLAHYNSKEMFSFWVTDGNIRVGGDHCLFNKAPDVTEGTGIPNWAWGIDILDYKMESVS